MPALSLNFQHLLCISSFLMCLPELFHLPWFFSGPNPKSSWAGLPPLLALYDEGEGAPFDFTVCPQWGLAKRLTYTLLRCYLTYFLQRLDLCTWLTSIMRSSSVENKHQLNIYVKWERTFPKVRGWGLVPLARAGGSVQHREQRGRLVEELSFWTLALKCS